MKSDWEGDLANIELKRHQHTEHSAWAILGQNLNCEDNETMLSIANEMSVNAARSDLSKCLHGICQFTAIFHKML